MRDDDAVRPNCSENQGTTVTAQAREDDQTAMERNLTGLRCALREANQAIRDSDTMLAEAERRREGFVEW